jgi:hypothetical protein
MPGFSGFVALRNKDNDEEPAVKQQLGVLLLVVAAGAAALGDTLAVHRAHQPALLGNRFLRRSEWKQMHMDGYDMLTMKSGANSVDGRSFP